MGFIRNILDRIVEYLPDEEPATEQERLYEEGKKQVYEMHQREKELFYAEESFLDGGKGKIYGEIVRGRFCPGDQVVMLDIHADPLLDGEILAVEKVSEEQEEGSKMVYLIFDGRKLQNNEEFFVKTYYLIKKH